MKGRKLAGATNGLRRPFQPMAASSRIDVESRSFPGLALQQWFPE